MYILKISLNLQRDQFFVTYIYILEVHTLDRIYFQRQALNYIFFM